MAHTTADLITQYEAELANIHAAMLEIEKRQQIAEQPEAKQIGAVLKRVFNDAVAQCEESC